VDDVAFAAAVEGVRQTLAAYCHALDDGRTDDVVALFCADAKIDFEGQGVFEGIDAIRAAYAGWAPRGPQRHLVLNTHVTEREDGRLHAVSDLVFLAKGESRWAVHMVGRYDDVLRRDDGVWRIHRRRATFS
jgi:3-phenylpropionate/cinnamic acid dioxygenase small subunit